MNSRCGAIWCILRQFWEMFYHLSFYHRRDHVPCHLVCLDKEYSLHLHWPCCFWMIWGGGGLGGGSFYSTNILDRQQQQYKQKSLHVNFYIDMSILNEADMPWSYCKATNVILEGIPYVFLPITRLPMRTDLEALANSNLGVANNAAKFNFNKHS